MIGPSTTVYLISWYLKNLLLIPIVQVPIVPMTHLLKNPTGPRYKGRWRQVVTKIGEEKREMASDGQPRTTTRGTMFAITSMVNQIAKVPATIVMYVEARQDLSLLS